MKSIGQYNIQFGNIILRLLNKLGNTDDNSDIISTCRKIELSCYFLSELHDGKLLTITSKISYFTMHYYYIDMQLIYINIQHSYANMQYQNEDRII